MSAPINKPRLISSTRLNDGSKKLLVEYNGLSTHEKPISDKFAFGSTFFEVDTQTVYFYNEDSSSWMTKSSGGDNND